MKLKQIKIHNYENNSDRQIDFNSDKATIVDTDVLTAIAVGFSPLISMKDFDRPDIKTEITVCYKQINYTWIVPSIRVIESGVCQLKYLVNHIEYEKRNLRNEFSVLSYFSWLDTNSPNENVRLQPQIKEKTAKVIKDLDDKKLAILVTDIVKNLAIANTFRTNILEGEAIILIDEQSLSLDLSKKAEVLEMFTKTFPNSQFIISSNK